MAEKTATVVGRSDDGSYEIAFRRTLGVPQIFRTQFDFQLVRALGAASYGGAAVGECFAAAHQIKDGDMTSWYEVWTRTAQRTEACARESLAGGHRVSAREAFLCACNYWRAAGSYALHSDPALLDTWKQSRACFHAAAELFDPPIEPIAIPYEDGKTLPGYFLKPDPTDAPKPTLVIVGGADSTVEETAFFGGGFAAIQRGYNALLVELPGQRGAFYTDPSLVYRPDSEVPLGSVLDYVLERADVDADRVGVSGYSWGGYFGPRAASVDRRIKAVIASALVPETRGVFMLLHGLDPYAPRTDDLESKVNWDDPFNAWFLDEIRWRCGYIDRTLAEWFDFLDEFNLWDRIDDIDCPLLAISAPGEGSYLEDLASRAFDRLKGPKTWRLTGEGAEAHCQVNSPTRGHQISFDWLDELFLR
jgi:hypothetical protein